MPAMTSSSPRMAQRLASWMRHRARVGIVLVASLALIFVSTLVAVAVVTTAPPAKLSAVGPVDPDNGFPTWYRDSNGLAVGQCTDPQDPMCGVVATSIPDPAAPVVFPTNFPAETFYMLASARISLPGGLNADLVTGLESAFATRAGPAPGQQVTFGRVRVRIDTPNPGHFVVTHPYGVDEFDAAGAGSRTINFTEDVGVAPGVFTGALQSRVNPFLTWDTGVVKGPNGDSYLGDPAVPHKVTGSALGTNTFRIDGPNIGGPGVDTITTDLFSLSGKVAKNFGVDAGHPTYTRTNTDGGSLDVFATTVPGEVVEARVGADGPTTLRGDAQGRYFGRLSFAGTPPGSVRVSNTSDSPATIVNAKVTDRVLVLEASYDNTSHTLSVRGASSDTAVPPELKVLGFGVLDASGQQTFADVDAPPQDVTITSGAGGRDTAPVVVDGVATVPNAVVASAGPDQAVRQSQKVALDGSATRNETSMGWSQVGGPSVVLTGTAPKVSFTAPDQDATLTFRLTAQGPGGPAFDEVSVVVAGLAPPSTSAGADQSAYAGDPVTLDGSGSFGADSYAWRQTAGPLVALAGSSTAKAGFTMPVATEPLVFALTTTGPGGTASATVTVTPLVDSVAVTQASYRTSTREWRIVGTASASAPDLVTVRLSAAGTLVGTATVDTTGAWAVRVKGSPVAPDARTAVTVTTSRGGSLADIRVTVSP